MVSRVESAAATRRALIDAAAALLDEGGPGAVTLREVGARAGVSRGAPYGHFADKESLLTAVATETLHRLADEVEALGGTPADRLRGALALLVAVGRRQPHRYRQMFVTPSGDTDAATRATGRILDGYLAIVTELVGERDARRYAGLLFTGVSGIINAELSGQLTEEKWGTSADELADTLVVMIERHAAG
jgi:AcrR family transcriptional regulator